MNIKKDYYQILQVHPSAERELIQAAYRTLSKKYHPDINESAESKSIMQELNEAYCILHDPEKRTRYDRSRIHYNPESPSSPNRKPGKKYGTNKASYNVAETENGKIIVYIEHSNKSFRQKIFKHQNNPSFLLRHLNNYSKSNIMAEYHLSQVMKDYTKQFESDQVIFDFSHNVY